MDPSLHGSRPAALKLAIPCRLAEVRGATEAVRAFLAEQGCSEEEFLDCELALAEACNNAIKYAGEPGREEPVRVDVLCDASEIEVRVTDHTPGFAWPAQVTLPSPESETGRGLYIICSVMNYAKYFRNSGENVLVMRKQRR